VGNIRSGFAHVGYLVLLDVEGVDSVEIAQIETARSGLSKLIGLRRSSPSRRSPQRVAPTDFPAKLAALDLMMGSTS